MRRSVWSTCAAVLALAAVAAPLASGASECAACQYQARNCSSSSASSASYSAVAGDDDGDGVDVCDAAGDIQFDDVFCDDDACDCASPRQCVSLVVGCTNLFQARSRKRCLGNDSIQLKFDRCAVNQGITDLDATNMASDWIFFKQFSQCVSSDCLATRQFHLSGLVQCGHMLAAWKDQNSSSNSTAASASTYHFIVDGSRASDLSAGTFHYSVPYDAASGALLYASSAANSTRIDKCYSLQTRNQKNSTTGTCDGVYLVRDTTTQLANTDDYDISKLTWPVYIGVVGSVAVAVGSIAAVATVFYRLKRAEKEANAAGCSGELLSDLDGVNDNSNHDSPVSGGERDIRQRSRESEDAEEKDAAVL